MCEKLLELCVAFSVLRQKKQTNTNTHFGWHLELTEQVFSSVRGENCFSVETNPLIYELLYILVS